MRRFIFTMLFAFSCLLTISAQQYQSYRATSYAVANVNQYTGKYTWSDWYRCTVNITFDLRNDVIVIYSNSPQRYVIMDSTDWYTDANGGKSVAFTVIDQDGDKGKMRLRIERNGNSQLYVDFSNVAWVYNVVRTA